MPFSIKSREYVRIRMRGFSRDLPASALGTAFADARISGNGEGCGGISIGNASIGNAEGWRGVAQVLAGAGGVCGVPIAGSGEAGAWMPPSTPLMSGISGGSAP